MHNSLCPAFPVLSGISLWPKGSLQWSVNSPLEQPFLFTYMFRQIIYYNSSLPNLLSFCFLPPEANLCYTNEVSYPVSTFNSFSSRILSGCLKCSPADPPPLGASVQAQGDNMGKAPGTCVWASSRENHIGPCLRVPGSGYEDHERWNCASFTTGHPKP